MAGLLVFLGLAALAAQGLMAWLTLRWLRQERQADAAPVGEDLCHLPSRWRMVEAATVARPLYPLVIRFSR